MSESTPNLVDELLGLASRVERASGADAGLDSDIWIAVGRPQEYLVRDLKLDPPEYSASIDAAMLLVPTDFHITHIGEARFMTRSPAFAATVETWGVETADDGSDVFTTPTRRNGVAATPALALTAASLRARAAALPQEGPDNE